MNEPKRILTAASSQDMLIERIAVQEYQLVEGLAAYDPRSATYAWFDTLRAIEECINLIHVNWEDAFFEKLLFSLSLSHDTTEGAEFKIVRQRFISQFSENFANRFTNLVIYGFAAAAGFRANGFLEIAEAFGNVGSMIGYLQSRRRHFIALLHMLPISCTGNTVVRPYDALLVFLPMIELTGIQLRTAQCALNVKLARAKLKLPEQNSVEIAMLDPFFLEPERAPMTTMPVTAEALTAIEERESLSSDRLFSAAELRNDILLIEAVYAEFNLKETQFGPAATLVRRLSTAFIERDFWIVVPKESLEAIFNELELSPVLRSALLHTGCTYLEYLSTYAPFVLIDGFYRSTVTLLSRFIYYWRGQILGRQRRFQIRAGFIFETAVANELEQQGFIVQDIRRINRREFDVVTVRNEVIWNIQCKNNFTNLEQVEADPLRFAKYNYGLVKYYERSLLKEKSREHLLTQKLSLNRIEHMIVSRFPVITDNTRFVPYSRIADFDKIADAVMAGDAFL